MGQRSIRSRLHSALRCGGADATLSTLHLVVGMGIFGSLVLALAWVLEAETGTDDETPVSNPTPAPEPAEMNREDSLSEGEFRERLRDRLSELPPDETRLMWLLCLVAAAGMALAAGQTLTSGTCLRRSVAVSSLSVRRGRSTTSSNATSTGGWSERATGRSQSISFLFGTLAFGLLLSSASLWLFWQVNALVAVLGLTAIVFYSVIYTLELKPDAVQTTVLGGAAGALPALIGWVAVDGSIGFRRRPWRRSSSCGRPRTFTTSRWRTRTTTLGWLPDDAGRPR